MVSTNLWPTRLHNVPLDISWSICFKNEEKLNNWDVNIVNFSMSVWTSRNNTDLVSRLSVGSASSHAGIRFGCWLLKALLAVSVLSCQIGPCSLVISNNKKSKFWLGTTNSVASHIQDTSTTLVNDVASLSFMEDVHTVLDCSSIIDDLSSAVNSSVYTLFDC